MTKVIQNAFCVQSEVLEYSIAAYSDNYSPAIVVSTYNSNSVRSVLQFVMHPQLGQNLVKPAKFVYSHHNGKWSTPNKFISANIFLKPAYFVLLLQATLSSID